MAALNVNVPFERRRTPCEVRCEKPALVRREGTGSRVAENRHDQGRHSHRLAGQTQRCSVFLGGLHRPQWLPETLPTRATHVCALLVGVPLNCDVAPFLNIL